MVKNTKLILIVYFAISLITLDIFASDKLNFKLGYSYKAMDDWMFNNGNYGQLTLDGNYKWKNYTGAGAYFGCTRSYIYPQYKRVNSYVYGLSSNLHIFPLILKSDNLKVDIYLTGKVGGYHIAKAKQNGFTANLGMGLAYYFSKKFGLFAEYSYGINEGKYRSLPYEMNRETINHISSFRFGISINIF